MFIQGRSSRQRFRQDSRRFPSTARRPIRMIPFGTVALLALFATLFSPCARCDGNETKEWKNVLYAVFRGADPVLNCIEKTLATNPEALALFKLERMQQTSIFTADGPDFSRPLGLVVRTDGKTLIPFWFFPVTDKVRRLNNIVLLPQIFLPIRDEYGPTKRYQIRQDIPILGGCHIFFWPLEPLLAEEREGWIWITTVAGFELIPKQPFDLLPHFKWNDGELFRARFDARAMPQNLTDGLLLLARMAACETERAPLNPQKVGPDGPKAFDVSARYVKRIMQATDSLEMLVRNDHGKFVASLNWKTRSDSDFGNFFKLQSSKSTSPRLADLLPNSQKELHKANLNLHLTDSETELVRAATDLGKLLNSRRTKRNSAKNFLFKELTDARMSSSTRFVDNGCTITVTLNETFFPHQISHTIRQLKEEKNKAQKKKPARNEEFDIIF